MDKQTIQELEIIIKAQCESARKDLKKIAKETQDTAKTISKSMDTINKDGSLDKLKKEIEDGKEKIKEFSEEIRTVHADNGDFEWTFKSDLSNFEENLEKARKEYEERQEAIEIPVEIKESTQQVSQPINSSNNTPNNSKNDLSNIGRVRKALADAKSEMNSLVNQAANLEIKNLNPYEIMSFKDSLKLLANQTVETIPPLSDLRQAFEQNLNGDFGDSLLQKGASAVVSLKDKFNDLGNTVKEKMSTIKSYISIAFSEVANPIKEKLTPITGLFENIGKFAVGSLNKAKTSLKQMADTSGTPINKLKQIIKHLKDVKNKSEDTSKSSKGFGSSFGKSFEKGIKSIKKFTLSLLSVRTAFSVVSKASQAYLSFDTQLQDSIQNSWNVLGSLLAPILEVVASLFNKLVSNVASFVKALTGIDLVARANSKALDKQAKSAKNASQSLAGIDDIDTLSTGKGDDNQTITADIDSTPFDKFVKKLKDIFSTIFEPFKLAWENVGTGVFDSIVNMITSLGELGGSVGGSLLEVWTNGTGQEIIENTLLIWQSMFDIVGGVASAIKHAWDNAGTGTSIIQHIANIFNDIQKFSLLIADSIKKWVVSDSFQEALDKVFKFIDDIFGYVQSICDWLLSMYDKYLKPVIDDKLLPAISSIITAIMDIWNTVKPVIDFCCQYIGAVLEPVIQGLCGFIGGIIDVIKGIADFISGVFTGNWKKAWDGIKNIFKGIWDMIASIVKTPINMILSGIEFLVNKIIDGFNFFKKAVNKISFDVPDWIPVIGGKKWGFNLKLSDNISLPRLATGNVAYEPTTAIFGEYANAKHDPEVTSPVSMMKDSFRDVLNEFEFGGTRFDTLKIDVAGENFYQGAVDYINEENTRKGVNIIKEV